MSNVVLSATVSSAAGVLFKQTYEIPAATQEQVDWLADAIEKANLHAEKVAKEPKEDNDSYSAVMTASVDGTAQPEARFDNVSYNAVVKQARYWQDNVTGEIVKIGEKVAKDKKKDARHN